jgi:diacylglycerol kinase (ATP)
MKKELNSFSVRQRLKSFRFAFAGLSAFIFTEHNARVHTVTTAAVIISGFLFNISNAEWLTVIIVTAMVWAAEIFNTVVERIMDHITPDYHPQVKTIKDLSAAAVLVTAIAALIAGLIIFIPKIILYADMF